VKPTVEALSAFLQPIRAYLAQDGGDIDFVRVSEDGRTLYVRLKGTCQTCELNSYYTLQLGVLEPLRRFFPSLEAIEVVEE
jgi:Fe-S cluster biogenesis protein NfuA